MADDVVDLLEALGEALVLLSSVEIDLPRVRTALSEIGVPNLWIPRVVCRCAAIPVLASGKLDLAGCKRMAVEKAG